MAGLHPKKTLVPVDFSELSLRALQSAATIAGDQPIHAVHVLPEMSNVDPGVLYGTVTDATRIANLEKHLTKVLKEHDLGHIQAHALIGDAGRQLAKFAEREQIDLIVIPSHGHGFFKHMLLGSVAERVVRLAHCPVLVLRE